MTSKLYEEAIADSKKLKSLLREEVEKDLIEKIKPLMEQALNSEIDSFLMEQEEEEAAAPEAPTAEAPTEAAAPEAAEAAPITPVGGQMNLPLPDESGLITVGFADLFSTPVAAPTNAMAGETEAAPETEEKAAAPEAPAAEASAPPASAPQALAEAKKIVFNLENEFNRLFSKNTLSLKEKTNFTYKLAEGYSELEVLKDSKLLKESTFNVLADKMENLFKRAEKSNKTSNSYSGTQKILEGKNMKVHPNTKSLINSLLETIETGYPQQKPVVVSKAERAGLPAKPKAVDPGRGRTAMFNHEAEVREDLLKEISDLEEQIDELAMEETLKADASGGLGLEEMDECGMDYDDSDDRSGKEVVIRIETEPKMHSGMRVMGHGMSEEGHGMKEEIANLEELVELQETLEEETAYEGAYEGVDEEVYEVNVDETATAEKEASLTGFGASSSAAAEAEKMGNAPPAAGAAAKRAAGAAAKQQNEMAALKENLASNEHLLARSILANKIFAEYDLSRKQKQLVVEYLDRAENVKDATRIYGRIKKQLVEAAASANAAEKKAGSLNESVSRTVSQSANAANKIVIGSADRFRELVAGNKNSR